MACALAGATIGVPLLGAFAPTPTTEALIATAAVGGPATSQVLSAAARSTPPTTILTPGTDSLRGVET
ncbi:MAG TPA: hypothetical protein PKB06_11945, partial [Actinotalea sp.]|nr:hypothetical protein [Actinotalea sp.]